VTSRSSADFDATRLMDLWEFQAKKKTHEAASSYPKCRFKEVCRNDNAFIFI